MYARAARMYRQVDVESAPKPTILDRLYGRCLTDLADARTAIERGDIKARAAAIDHAWRIITELQASLDANVSGELCTNLYSLYDYVLDRLATANLKQDARPLSQASEVIDHLRESFQQAVAQQ